MAKLVFGMNQSLDGYVDHVAFAPSPALFRHFIEEAQRQAGSVYGRHMYEVMRYWDHDQPEWDVEERAFAAAWRRLPKWVVSRSLTSVGPNASLVSGDVEAAIRGLKAERDGKIEVAGPALAHSLTEAGLIDEYRIYLHPVVLGGGKPFLAGRRPPLRLVAADFLLELRDGGLDLRHGRIRLLEGLVRTFGFLLIQAGGQRIPLGLRLAHFHVLIRTRQYAALLDDYGRYEQSSPHAVAQPEDTVAEPVLLEELEVDPHIGPEAPASDRRGRWARRTGPARRPARRPAPRQRGAGHPRGGPRSAASLRSRTAAGSKLRSSRGLDARGRCSPVPRTPRSRFRRWPRRATTAVPRVPGRPAVHSSRGTGIWLRWCSGCRRAAPAPRRGRSDPYNCVLSAARPQPRPASEGGGS